MMDAQEVVSDGQLLSDFLREFMELTAANIEAQTKALERLRALAASEGEYDEFDAIAKFVEVGDSVYFGGLWRTVTESVPCSGGYPSAAEGWHLVCGAAVYCFGRAERFRVRRPRGERAA